MKIDGKMLADKILNGLATEVTNLKNRGITPTLAVILVGDNPASLAYIKQKQKAAEKIGAKIIFDHQPTTIDASKLRELVNLYNADATVHGLIIQRPIPNELGNVSTILDSVKPEKDVDGFLPDSPFDVPVAAAVGEILQNATYQMLNAKFVVIGRGETAGKPIAAYLTKKKYLINIIHSSTPNPIEFMRQADVIITCVGKKRVVTREAVKRGAILISVGIWRDEEGKLHGDYEEDDIADITSFYTPTPGGVGPVNVACLMQNLIKACTLIVRG